MTAFEFAIVSADERYLGGCGLNQIDKANNRANLATGFDRGATRQRVATAAVRKVQNWAFQKTDLIPS
jgi:RimJ/RimL family protein N-acetyltransferase